MTRNSRLVWVALFGVMVHGACNRAPSEPSGPSSPVVESNPVVESSPLVERSAAESPPVVEPAPDVDEELERQLLEIEFDCPFAEVTEGGEALDVVTALAWRVENDTTVVGDYVMLTDEDITCEVIMDHRFTPIRHVTAIVSGVAPRFNAVRNINHTEMGMPLRLARAGEQGGESQVICIPEPIAIEGTHRQEFSAVGLFIGEFCGTSYR